MITHNRENLVGFMIDDIINQSFADFEFIIINNGSRDKSSDIIDWYAEKDSRITAYHLPEEVSIGKARNIGISHAKGEFVAYVDDDDRVDKDYLEFLNALQKKYKADCAMCGIMDVVEGERYPQCCFEETYVYSNEEVVRELLERSKIRAGLPTKLIRRNIIEKYLFCETCKHEDIHATYKFLSEVHRAVICGQPKYYAVRHNGNISSFTSDVTKLTEEGIREYLYAFQERTVFLSEKFPDMGAYVQYCEWAYMISMVEKIENHHIEKCMKLEKEIIQKLYEVSEQFLTMPYIKDFEVEWMRKYVQRIK